MHGDFFYRFSSIFLAGKAEFNHNSTDKASYGSENNKFLAWIAI
jgi:hypothetical protein